MKIVVPASVILLVAIIGNTIEFLTDKEYPSALILFWGGAISFLINGFFLLKKRHRFLPQKPKLQIIRFFTTGISSFLIFESYKYLAAGSVSLVQRVDIPLIVLISMFSGEKRSSLQFWLSFWVLAMIGFLILDSRFIDEEPIGFLLVFTGVVMVSFSYLLVKRSAESENVYLISNVNSLAMMAVGSVVMSITKSSWYIQWPYIWLFGLIGVCFFLLYIVGIRLYKWYNTERARFPFIIGTLATMCLEMIIEHKLFSPSQIALTLLIAGMIATISLNASVPTSVVVSNKKLRLFFPGKAKNKDLTSSTDTDLLA